MRTRRQSDNPLTGFGLNGLEYYRQWDYCHDYCPMFVHCKEKIGDCHWADKVIDGDGPLAPPHRDKVRRANSRKAATFGGVSYKDWVWAAVLMALVAMMLGLCGTAEVHSLGGR